MIPEFGLLALIIALMFALLSGSYPIWRRYIPAQPGKISTWLYAQSFFVLSAYCVLTFLFLRSDFTVLYVAENSSTLLPWYYRVTAVWGAHEGSILLWVSILSLWVIAFTRYATAWSGEVKQDILAILSVIQAGFLAFIIFTSNPFLRYFDSKLADGQDLNPLLQDPGFLIHPPVLYTGYVGFAIAFAVCFVGLARKTFDQSWAKALRSWTQVAWAFLTLGIMLGSWWAYRELGWGGFWFWDPVENASFMPWLSGTALLHSLVVSEKRQQFYAWSILLALLSFSLSLLGTFLVRSGVLTSVHAFASDPARGVYILCFLSVIVLSSLSLFAKHADALQKPIRFSALSKETLLLGNNLVLFVLMSTVLLGTLYPLVMQMMHWGKLSIGAPYFNAIFAPIMLPTLFLMGGSAYVVWYRDELSTLWQRLWKPLLMSCLFVMAAMAVSYQQSIGFYLAWLGCGFLIVSSLHTWLRQQPGFKRQALPMTFAHVGVALTAIGIVSNLSLSQNLDVAMAIGDRVQLGSYQIQFKNVREVKMSNYDSITGQFELFSTDQKRIAVLEPEKRYYRLRRQMMTDAAIHTTPLRDIYIALGNQLQDGRFGVRLYDKPFIRWIWLGALLMVAGASMSLWNRRGRVH